MKNLPLPPGNLGLPIVGETIEFLTDGDFGDKRQKKYGNVFKSSILGRPTVFISGAEAIRFLFANENKYFVATWPQNVKTLLGPASLATQTGNFHTARRKLLYQAFQPRALANYIPTMETITAKYLEKWQNMKTFAWNPELNKYTFDIASTILIGRTNATETDLFNLFEDWLKGLFSIPIPLPITRFGKALQARQGLLKEIEKIVLERQKEKNITHQDALELLLKAQDEDGNSLSLEELKDQILLILFAGHETLSSALTSFCLLIAQHRDVLDKIRAEQSKFNLEENLTLDTLKEMTYLEQVLKEVLRFISPVGGGFREVTQDCEYQGYLIPKGWVVQYQITRTHKDADLYTNPEKFDPDRFSPERAEDKQQTFGYVSFGGGLRECLGKEFARLEMKIFATRLVQKYDWELLSDQDLSLITIPTPHPRDGLKVNFHPL